MQNELKDKALEYINSLADLRFLFLEISDAKALKSACLRHLGDKHQVLNAILEYPEFEVFIKPVYGAKKYCLELQYLESGDGDKMSIFICHYIEVMDGNGDARLEKAFIETSPQNYLYTLEQEVEHYQFDSIQFAQWAAVAFMNQFKQNNNPCNTK